MEIGVNEPPVPRVQITASGTAYILETKFVNGIVNGLDSDAIIAFANQVLPGQLNVDNVLPGVMVSGDTSGRTSDDETLMEFIQAMSDSSGYNFYVDYYYYLHYEPLGYSTPSFSLSDQPDYISSFPYYDWINEIDGTQIGNRVTVHGGPWTATTDETTVIVGNAVTSVSMAQVGPTEVLNVQVNGTEQSKGIQGNSKTTFTNGYQCLIDFPNHQVIFPSGALHNGDSVYVKYVYGGNIREQVIDIVSVNKYKKRNFDGLFDRKINDQTITTSDAAIQRAIIELNTYANGVAKPEFKTYMPIDAGQTVLITNHTDGYTFEPFLVNEVDITLLGNGFVEYYCKAGADLPTFLRAMKRLHKAVNRSKKIPATALTSLSLIVRDRLTFVGDQVTVTQDTTTEWYYNDMGARYGYASYGSTYTPPTPAPGTYGNATYGVNTWHLLVLPANQYGTGIYNTSSYS
ncbi:MAG TPA: hypothetical protein VH593_00230, partial [Ktedonobacteraceae bacterium]|jgi:hypothetical protein